MTITLRSHVLVGVAGVLAGVMRSSGDVLVPTAVSIGAIWAVQRLSAYLLSRRIGIDGVWLGYPVAFTAMLMGQAAYYALIWYRRRHHRLI